MCADVAIHDPYPPGHNPHAHILLTVRPLDEKGKWQYKTEKEYLCVKNGKEQGFTAAEFKQAQADGWEKQYQYKVGKKKVYMVPSSAQAQGYFAKRKLSEITAKDIMRWQNEIREMRDCHGKPLSKTYLKTVHNQLSAIFNHAARFYGLNLNPARQAGNMGAEERKEMLFWTREEYTKFSEAMMDKPLSFYAFEVLYWCGIREGELLALTPADFDFEKRTLTINKSYQRLNKQDVITTPKTPKSNRVIQMPQFLCDELQDYLKQLYGVEPDSRMFPISKSYLHREMDRGCKQTGVKRIRIHDLRHSHISLLIDMGFTALAIAERVGHESIDITYRYAHLFPTRQVEMADKLDSLKNEKGV